MRAAAAAAALGVAVALLPGPAGATDAAPPADSRDLTTLVSTMAGSFGAGFTFTGAQAPFGMLQMGPDTNQPGAYNPLNYTGYAYHDSQIHGFSLSHFSGAGIKIGGELPFLPRVGAVQPDALAAAEPFEHATEVATPGYYGVTLARSGVRVELAAGERAGIQRYTFPASTAARVQLFGSLAQTAPSASTDPASRNAPHLADLHVVGDRTLAGSTVEPRSGGHTEWFAAEFDRPFSGRGTWSGSTVRDGSSDTTGSADGAYVTFDTTANPTVSMRVALSYTSAAGAAANLAAEVPPGTTLEQVRTRAHDSWNARLHDIEVTGSTAADQQTFYSMLYRALGMPNLFDDADGLYTGFDGVVRPVRPGEHHYTNLSLWDTYKTQVPLLALIEPKVQHDVVMSLLDDYDQSGQIPKWVDANREYGIEGGDSGSATVADGVARGLLNAEEVSRAYAALRDQATRVPPAGPAREHLDEIADRGWVGYTTSSGRPVADTVEYAVDDAAILPLARLVGTAADVALFSARAGGWRNLLWPGRDATDPDRFFIRQRHADGSWADPSPPAPWSPLGVAGYQEASAGRPPSAGCRRTFSATPRSSGGRRRWTASTRSSPPRSPTRRTGCRTPTGRTSSTTATSTHPATRPTCPRPGITTCSGSRGRPRRSCGRSWASSTAPSMPSRATTTPGRWAHGGCWPRSDCPAGSRRGCRSTR